MNNITQVQFLRGDTAQNEAYLGRAGQLTIDEERKTLRIHDGVTVGGFEVPGDVFPYFGHALISGSFVVIGMAYTSRYDNGLVSGSYTVDWTRSNHQSVTLAQHTDLQFSGSQAGAVYSLEVRFTGAVSASWDSLVRWPDNGAGEPQQSMVDNRKDIYTFYNDGTVYNGQVFGYNYALT